MWAKAQGSNGLAGFYIPGTYTWTAPSGISTVYVSGCGGGGGGGGWAGGGAPGGGSGRTVRNIPIAVVSGNTYTIVVGVAGAGAVPGESGGNGSGSLFSAWGLVIGGGGGAGSVFVQGAAGGPGGQTGAFGATYPAVGNIGGAGGSTEFGPGGAGIYNGSGQSAGYYCGGGSGNAAGAVGWGGWGGNGFIELAW